MCTIEHPHAVFTPSVRYIQGAIGEPFLLAVKTFINSMCAVAGIICPDFREAVCMFVGSTLLWCLHSTKHTIIVTPDICADSRVCTCAHSMGGGGGGGGGGGDMSATGCTCFSCPWRLN